MLQKADLIGIVEQSFETHWENVLSKLSASKISPNQHELLKDKLLHTVHKLAIEAGIIISDAEHRSADEHVQGKLFNDQ